MTSYVHTQRGYSASFGFGFPAYRLPLTEIASARAVPNNIVTGYGVRLIPGGVLYNVGGKYAVEIERRGKGRIRIATDDPEGLLVAIGHAPSNLDKVRTA